MVSVIELIILLGVISAFAFFRTPILVWTVILAIVLMLLTVSPHFTWWLLTPLWAFYLLIAFILNFSPCRYVITRVAIRHLQNRLPSISDTEREAIEAGDVWWESELFCGQPKWEKLLKIPLPTLTEEEQEFLDNQVEKLCALLDDWQITHKKADLSKQAWDYIKEEKFFGLLIDKKYGGHGFSSLASSTIVMKIATRSNSAAVTVMVPNSLGPAELLHRYGTEEQKNYYLPRLAAAKEIPCFALTSTEAGSDAGAIQDVGIVCKGRYQGKEVIGIRLNWNKRYITLAPVSTVLGLAFKLYDPDHLLGETENRGITVCLVPTHHPGVEVGKRHSPMGMAFMNGPTRGKDVFVPLEWVVGGPAMCGRGWRMLMECLSAGRGISLPALATAGGKLCYRTTGAYAKIRKQFRVSIGELEGVAESLARMGGYTYLCEATRRLTVSGIDQGMKPAVTSAITKYHLTELNRQMINDAMDIHAGRGVQAGPRNYLIQGYEAIPVSITVEGANILTRNLIIFGQGAIRCHPYIRREINALNNPDKRKRLKEFDSLFYKHIGYTLCNLSRTLWFGLTQGKLINAPVQNHVVRHYRQLTRMSSALALFSDITLLVLGGDLKRKERLSARLGDILSHLYMASAVLKYYEDYKQPSSDVNLVNWSIAYCLYRTQIAFDELVQNFPKRRLAKLLWRFIFPWGRVYHLPSDELGHRVASDMMSSSSLRDRLTEYCYMGEEGDPVYRVEKAFRAVLKAEPATRKLNNAIKCNKINKNNKLEDKIKVMIEENILTQEEGEQLQEAEKLVLDALQVDEFSKL